MSRFPREILFEILVRLPPEDLIRSLCVSKAWYALIRDDRFIKSHLQRSIHTDSFRTLLLEECNFENESFDFFSLPFYNNDTFGTAHKIEQPLQCPSTYTPILSCCIHGLVCIQNGDSEDIALWNPSIQKFKKIPLPNFEEQQPSSDLMISPCYGSGYDSVNDDYKLVNIVNFLNEKYNIVSTQVNVYSLKSNSWKRIQDSPCDGFYRVFGELVFSNGALCWLMLNNLDEILILALDISTEKYHQFSTPVDDGGYSMLNLEVLGDSLCIRVHSQSRNDFWIMKEYGVSESWTMLYSIERGVVPGMLSNCKTLVRSKNGKMVLLVTDDIYNRFTWFDLEEKRCDEVEICSLPGHFVATICVGSLCLLDGDPFIG